MNQNSASRPGWQAQAARNASVNNGGTNPSARPAPGKAPNALADCRRLMRAAIRRWPDLTDFGFGVWDARRKSASVLAEEFTRERAELFTDVSLCAFERAREWLARWVPTKSFCACGTSYGLKHAAEHEIGYVTNGVFIAAAISLGIKIKRDGPNAALCLPRRAWTMRRVVR